MAPLVQQSGAIRNAATGEGLHHETRVQGWSMPDMYWYMSLWSPYLSLLRLPQARRLAGLLEYLDVLALLLETSGIRAEEFVTCRRHGTPLRSYLS